MNNFLLLSLTGPGHCTVVQLSNDDKIYNAIEGLVTMKLIDDMLYD